MSKIRSIFDSDEESDVDNLIDVEESSIETQENKSTTPDPPATEFSAPISAFHYSLNEERGIDEVKDVIQVGFVDDNVAAASSPVLESTEQDQQLEKDVIYETFEVKQESTLDAKSVSSSELQEKFLDDSDDDFTGFDTADNNLDDSVEFKGFEVKDDLLPLRKIETLKAVAAVNDNGQCKKYKSCVAQSNSYVATVEKSQHLESERQIVRGANLVADAIKVPCEETERSKSSPSKLRVEDVYTDSESEENEHLPAVTTLSVSKNQLGGSRSEQESIRSPDSSRVKFGMKRSLESSSPKSVVSTSNLPPKKRKVEFSTSLSPSSRTIMSVQGSHKLSTKNPVTMSSPVRAKRHKLLPDAHLEQMPAFKSYIGRRKGDGPNIGRFCQVAMQRLNTGVIKPQFPLYDYGSEAAQCWNQSLCRIGRPLRLGNTAANRPVEPPDNYGCSLPRLMNGRRVITPLVKGSEAEREYHCTPNCEDTYKALPCLPCLKCQCLFHPQCIHLPYSLMALIVNQTYRLLCPNCYLKLKRHSSKIIIPPTEMVSFEPLTYQNDPIGDSSDCSDFDEGVGSDSENLDPAETAQMMKVDLRPPSPTTPDYCLESYFPPSGLSGVQQRKMARQALQHMQEPVAAVAPYSKASGSTSNPIVLDDSQSSLMQLACIVLKKGAKSGYEAQQKDCKTPERVCQQRFKQLRPPLPGGVFLTKPLAARPSGSQEPSTQSSALSVSNQSHALSLEVSHPPQLMLESSNSSAVCMNLLRDSALGYSALRLVVRYLSPAQLLVMRAVCVLWRDLTHCAWEKVWLDGSCKVRDWAAMAAFLSVHRCSKLHLDVASLLPVADIAPIEAVEEVDDNTVNDPSEPVISAALPDDHLTAARQSYIHAVEEANDAEDATDASDAGMSEMEQDNSFRRFCFEERNKDDKGILETVLKDLESPSKDDSSSDDSLMENDDLDMSSSKQSAKSSLLDENIPDLKDESVGERSNATDPSDEKLGLCTRTSNLQIIKISVKSLLEENQLICSNSFEKKSASTQPESSIASGEECPQVSEASKIVRPLSNIASNVYDGKSSSNEELKVKDNRTSEDKNLSSDHKKRTLSELSEEVQDIECDTKKLKQNGEKSEVKKPNQSIDDISEIQIRSTITEVSPSQLSNVMNTGVSLSETELDAKESKQDPVSVHSESQPLGSETGTNCDRNDDMKLSEICIDECIEEDYKMEDVAKVLDKGVDENSAVALQSVHGMHGAAESFGTITSDVAEKLSSPVKTEIVKDSDMRSSLSDLSKETVEKIVDSEVASDSATDENVSTLKNNAAVAPVMVGLAAASPDLSKDFDKKMICDSIAYEKEKIKSNSTELSNGTQRCDQSSPEMEIDKTKSSPSEGVSTNEAETGTGVGMLVSDGQLVVATASNTAEVVEELAELSIKKIKSSGYLYSFWERVCSSVAAIEHLQELSLSNCQGDFLEVLLPNCDKLRVLRISNNVDADEELLTVDPNLLKCCHNLEELFISSNFTFSSEFSFTEMPKLHRLGLNGGQFESFPGVGSNLTHLYVNPVSNFSMDTWANIAALTDLQELALSKFSSNEEQCWQSSVTALPNLCSLALESCPLTETTLKALQQLPRLEQLCLLLSPIAEATMSEQLLRVQQLCRCSFKVLLLCEFEQLLYNHTDGLHLKIATPQKELSLLTSECTDRIVPYENINQFFSDESAARKFHFKRLAHRQKLSFPRDFNLR